MERLAQDLRFALRLFRKDRAFALTTILTLALCIGANTAIFTVVRSVLLRPLPYPESERLVFLYESFPGAGVERAGTSVPNYFDRLALTDVFESQALYQNRGSRAGQGAGAEGVASMNVTPSFFTVLKVPAARGRLFTEDDGTPGRNRVTVLSWTFAKKQPGGVDGVVGRELLLNDERHTVVGVLPESFTFLNPELRLWVPLAFTEAERGDDRRYSQNHDEIARLAPGQTPAQARSRVAAQDARNIEQAGPLKSVLINAGYRTEVRAFSADLVRNVRAALQMLWGGVACLLLIAAVNITNLSLARASGRMKEVATRHALGAARARVVRQLVTETMLLTLVGGGLGLALGYWGLGALTSLGLADIPRAHEIRMDAVVVFFILGLAIALGMVVGAVPAMHIAGLEPERRAARRQSHGHGRPRRQSGTRRARRRAGCARVRAPHRRGPAHGELPAAPGRRPRVHAGACADRPRLTAGRRAIRTTTALRSYTARALDRIRTLPGVEAAGATSYLPFSFDGNSSVIIPEGYVMSPGESVVSPNQLVRDARAISRRCACRSGADGSSPRATR